MNSTWLDGHLFAHPLLLKLLSWPWPKSLRFSTKVVASQSEGAGPLRHSIELWLPLDRSVWCGNKQTTPTNSGHALGHWFHVVCWHLTFSVDSAPQSRVQEEFPPTLAFLQFLLTQLFTLLLSLRIQGPAHQLPILAGILSWLRREDSVWVTRYETHEFPSLISVLILIAKQTCKTSSLNNKGGRM